MENESYQKRKVNVFSKLINGNMKEFEIFSPHDPGESKTDIPTNMVYKKWEGLSRLQFESGSLKFRYAKPDTEFFDGWVAILELQLTNCPSLESLFLATNEQRKYYPEYTQNAYERPGLMLLGTYEYYDGNFPVLDNKEYKNFLDEYLLYVGELIGMPGSTENDLFCRRLLQSPFISEGRLHLKIEFGHFWRPQSQTWVVEKLQKTFLPIDLNLTLWNAEPGKDFTPLAFTFGPEETINHPVYGRVPEGVDYLDLSTWTAQETYVLTADNIKTTGK